MSIESVIPSNHLVLPSIFPSIRVFFNELALCIRHQSIGASASASVLPMNIQGWFPLELTGLIFFQSKGLSGVFSNTTSILCCSALFIVQLSYPYITTGKNIALTQFSSVDQSCLTVCHPYGLQHTRPPYLSPTPRVYSNSCPLSWWCHPTISSSVVPFSSCLQSFQASRSFSVSCLFASGGQSVGVSASASSEYSGLISFRMDWLDLLAVQETLKSLLQQHS